MVEKNKLLLIIMDGWGLTPNETGNAPMLARTPTLDFVYGNYPKTSLSASGIEVGLSPGEVGNSEVGHSNIGSGRVVWESLPRINQAIEDGSFSSNKAMLDAFSHVLANNSTLHLIGLVSDGGVHSHVDHLLKIIDCAAEHKVANVLIHLISDGRDTPAREAQAFARKLEVKFAEHKIGRIATLVGRFFAMDRDNNKEREVKAFNLFLQNEGKKYSDIETAIRARYSENQNDEMIEPSVIGEGGIVTDNDAVIFYNFRSDRMKQLYRLFCTKEKDKEISNLHLLTMMDYEKDQPTPMMFLPLDLKNTVSEVIASASKEVQIHTAETEKFAHVTYFFKAGKEELLPGEKDELVPSRKVASYAEIPEMSAKEITKVVLTSIENESDFIVVNYANGDMVGHTGDLEAAIKACESVDQNLSYVLAAASEKGYRAIITADHGNCEVMIDEVTSLPNTEHTTNPVPFVFLDFAKRPFSSNDLVGYSRKEYAQYSAGTPIGVLADVAPSILSNLNLPQPEEMSGMDLTVAMQ